MKILTSDESTEDLYEAVESALTLFTFELFFTSKLSCELNVLLLLLLEDEIWCLGIIGVIDGDGDGVGTSWIGDKHLLGTSRRIVGGCNKLLEAILLDDFWLFIGSSTET